MANEITCCAAGGPCPREKCQHWLRYTERLTERVQRPNRSWADAMTGPHFELVTKTGKEVDRCGCGDERARLWRSEQERIQREEKEERESFEQTLLRNSLYMSKEQLQEQLAKPLSEDVKAVLTRSLQRLLAEERKKLFASIPHMTCRLELMKIVAKDEDGDFRFAALQQLDKLPQK